MGLDNMPHEYPCKTQGTAIMEQRVSQKTGEALLDEDGQPMMTIKCEETQEAGGCPYQNAFAKSGITEGRVYGMFGTDCWYRGKYGNAILAEASHNSMDDEFTFYGDNDDASHKSAESCTQLADFIKVVTASYENEDIAADADKEFAEDKADVLNGLRYAEWYLRWAAAECGGLDCWY